MKKCIDEACKVDLVVFEKIKRPAITVPMEHVFLPKSGLLCWDVPKKPRKHRKASSTSFKRRTP